MFNNVVAVIKNPNLKTLSVGLYIGSVTFCPFVGYSLLFASCLLLQLGCTGIGRIVQIGKCFWGLETKYCAKKTTSEKPHLCLRMLPIPSPMCPTLEGVAGSANLHKQCEAIYTAKWLLADTVLVKRGIISDFHCSQTHKYLNGSEILLIARIKEHAEAVVYAVC